MGTTILVGALVALPHCDGSTPSTNGGTPRGLPRLDPVERPVQDELLSNFELQAPSFEFAAGHGRWEADASDGDTMASLEPSASIEAGGATDTAYALQVHGASTAVSARLAAVGGARVLHDLSSCDGLRFWAKTDGAEEAQLTVRVSSPAGAAQTAVSLEDGWTELSVDWEDLEEIPGGEPEGMGGSAGDDLDPSQGGAFAGGASAGGPFDVEAVTALHFDTDGVAYWLDEVTLTNCQLPQLNPDAPPPSELGSGAPAGSPVARHGHLRVEGATLVDQSGEPVQLKGVSSMWTNWDAYGFADNRQALEHMRDAWDLSVFRVAMGVEETGGYLGNPSGQRRKVERAIANALELGVYLIVDWHAHEAQLEPDAARGFFDELAAEYGEHPNLIWEPFNEPLQVDWSRDLKPYHVSLIETIRQRDPDNLILLGTPQWSQLVDRAAADPIGGRNLLYVMHFYACTHTSWLRDLADEALGAGAGLFVSEFGGTHADGGTDGVVCDGETNTWFDWMDDNGVSGVAWKLDSCGRDSSCLLTPSAPRNGPWEDEHLHGHAPLVVDWLRR